MGRRGSRYIYILLYIYPHATLYMCAHTTICRWSQRIENAEEEGQSVFFIIYLFFSRRKGRACSFSMLAEDSECGGESVFFFPIFLGGRGERFF